jgi:hypothetical protein
VSRPSDRGGHPAPRRRIGAAAVAIAVALVLAAAAGCGSSGAPLDAAAVTSQATTLHGLAGEGSVIATATARGDLTTPYRRVHAGELADAAASTSDALTRPVTSDALVPVARRLRAEAVAVAAAFRALAAPAVSPATARAARATFARSAAVTAGLGR